MLYGEKWNTLLFNMFVDIKALFRKFTYTLGLYNFSVEKNKYVTARNKTFKLEDVGNLFLEAKAFITKSTR